MFNSMVVIDYIKIYGVFFFIMYNYFYSIMFNFIKCFIVYVRSKIEFF